MEEELKKNIIWLIIEFCSVYKFGGGSELIRFKRVDELNFFIVFVIIFMFKCFV